MQAVWDQPFDIRLEPAYTLPRVISSGADGKPFTLDPVAPVFHVLSAIG